MAKQDLLINGVEDPSDDQIKKKMQLMGISGGQKHLKVVAPDLKLSLLNKKNFSMAPPLSPESSISRYDFSLKVEKSAPSGLGLVNYKYEEYQNLLNKMDNLKIRKFELQQLDSDDDVAITIKQNNKEIKQTAASIKSVKEELTTLAEEAPPAAPTEFTTEAICRYESLPLPGSSPAVTKEGDTTIIHAPDPWQLTVNAPIISSGMSLPVKYTPQALQFNSSYDTQYFDDPTGTIAATFNNTSLTNAAFQSDVFANIVHNNSLAGFFNYFEDESFFKKKPQKSGDDPFYKFFRDDAYHRITLQFIRKITDQIVESKYFDAKNLKRLDLSRDCPPDTSDPSLLNIADIKNKLKGSISESCLDPFNSVDNKMGPIEVATKSGVALTILRLYMIESLLKSVFILSEFNIKDIFKDNLITDFLIQYFMEVIEVEMDYKFSKNFLQTCHMIIDDRKNADLEIRDPVTAELLFDPEIIGYYNTSTGETLEYEAPNTVPIRKLDWFENDPIKSLKILAKEQLMGVADDVINIFGGENKQIKNYLLKHFILGDQPGEGKHYIQTFDVPKNMYYPRFSFINEDKTFQSMEEVKFDTGNIGALNTVEGLKDGKLIVERYIRIEDNDVKLANLEGLGLYERLGYLDPSSDPDTQTAYGAAQ